MAGLGELLLQQGVIEPDALRRAEAHAAAEGGGVARALVALGLASDSAIVQALARSLGMEFVDLDNGGIDPVATRLLPIAQAQALTALPVRFGDADDLVVAVADPNGGRLAPQLEELLGVQVTLALAPRRSLVRAIESLAVEAADPVHARGDGAFPDGPPPGPTPALGPSAAPGRQGPTVLSEDPTAIDLDQLLATLLDRGGSDLHLTAGVPPVIRVDGALVRLDDQPVLVPDELRKLLYGIMPHKQRETFENELELDMSYALPGRGRFRVNVFRQRDSLGAALRAIPHEILSVEELGLPPQVANLAHLPRGLVLVTGPTGAGKSTTLASLIDVVNRTRQAHIVTVEDPIEFLHEHKRSVVNQREVGTDTRSFAQALKHVLRQDPDVVLVGEMRDLETIQIALTAAETGHLVFATLHTQDAPQTVDRVIDVFPPHQQEQIRVMLAGSLKGVLCQVLLKTAEEKGRTVAAELMVATSGIRNLIREGKTHQIYSAIQAGGKDGMVSMDQSLARLVTAGKVTYEAAMEKCQNLGEFNRLVGRA